MRTSKKKFLALSAVMGAAAGILIISPFAMTVSSLLNRDALGLGRLGFWQIAGYALKKSAGPNPAMWYVTHAAVGALLAFLYSSFFLRLLDETETRHAVEMLFKREEMTLEMGKLAGGIVHNIGNHLSVLDGYLELIKTDYPNKERINAALAASAEVKAITRNVMEHLGRNRGAQKEIDLNAVIVKNLEFLKGNMFFKHQVTAVTELSPDLPKMTGEEIHFSQTLYNLLDNAVDAMARSPKKELKVRSRWDNDWIYVDIIDSGEGIPKEVQAKLFMPGFTTKPFTAQKDEPTGTGFGLANAKSLMSFYGAKIEAESRPGETRFTLAVPRNPGRTTSQIH